MTSPRFLHLVLLAAVLWGGEMVRRDCWEPDEARVAYVSREMAQDGNWLVLHRHGEPYAHKPPLLYWLINLFSFVTTLPIGRLTVRLPGFFAGILVLWSTARLAERWAGAKAAWPAVLTLCTTYLFWHEIGFSRPDGLLLGWTMGAMALLFWNDDAPRFWKPALAWLFMGLGILTKGPVGIIIPAGAYAAARFAAGAGRLLRKFHWVWGPFLALALPAIWLGLVWWSAPPAGYLRELLIGQNIERAAGRFAHQQPFYYYFYSIAADGLPWTLCLPAAVLILFRDPQRRLLLRRLGGWIGFIVLFFTVLTTKRNVYVLGVMPAFAILVGAAWPDLNAASFRWARFARGAFLALLVVAGIGLFVAGFWPGLPFVGWPFRIVGVIALLGGFALWNALHWCRPPHFFGVAAITLLLAEWAVGLFVYPAINPLKTPVALAAAVQARLPSDRPLLLYAINGELLAFHSNRRGKIIYGERELLAAIKRERAGFVVFEKSVFDSWPAQFPLIGTTSEFRTGSRKYVLLEFDRNKTM